MDVAQQQSAKEKVSTKLDFRAGTSTRKFKEDIRRRTWHVTNLIGEDDVLVTNYVLKNKFHILELIFREVT